MFTKQAPLMLNSLGNMPADDVRQLTQVFANCNQSLSHRAGVSLRNGRTPNSGGLVDVPAWASGNYAGNGEMFGLGNWSSGGYYGGDYYGVDGPRNSQQILFNQGNQLSANYSIYNEGDYEGGTPFYWNNDSSYRGGDTHIQQGDTPYYDLQTNITNQQVYEYGGPVFQVAGDSFFDNSVTNNQTVNNQYVTNQTVEETKVTNIVVGAQGGDPGRAGPAGPPGAPGNPGQAGPAGPADGVIVLPPQVVRNFRLIKNALNINVAVFFRNPRIKIQVPTYTFDAENCDIVEGQPRDVWINLNLADPGGRAAVQPGVVVTDVVAA